MFDDFYEQLLIKVSQLQISKDGENIIKEFILNHFTKILTLCIKSKIDIQLNLTLVNSSHELYDQPTKIILDEFKKELVKIVTTVVKENKIIIDEIKIKQFKYLLIKFQIY